MIYEQYFSLTQRPFSIAPNPHFLFAIGQYTEALAVLEYGVHHRGGFVLLTGEVGTGKTTLAKHIVSHAPEDTELALIIHSQLDRLAFLQQVCHEFTVPFNEQANEAQLIVLLHEFLMSVYSKGGYCLLMIDEAQHLSFEVLELVRLLTNLETNTEKLLQIILLGQPELKQRLAQYNLRQLNQRFTARFHLKSLGLIETKKYVEYRLSVAGNNEHIFSLPAIVMLHRFSKGVPRLINVLADRCLMGCYAHDRRKVSVWMVAQAAKEVFGRASENKFFLKSLLVGFSFSVIFILAVVLAGGQLNTNLSDFLARFKLDNSTLSAEVSAASKTPALNCFAKSGCWQGDIPAALLSSNQNIQYLNAQGSWVPWQGQVSTGLVYVKVNLPAQLMLMSPIKLGQTDPIIPWVTEVLAKQNSRQFSDVSTWQRIEPQGDATVDSGFLSQSQNIFNQYNQTLQWQIKAFQQEHELQVDGVIGMQTMSALYLMSIQEGV